MRLLHCSDLHIGKRVNEFSMIDEQRHCLAQITEIAKVQQVNGVLIAGDVYDKTVPSVEAVQLFDRFLTDLAAQHLPVYIISGNHDSPERLSFGEKMLVENQIYLSPVFDGTLRKITLEDDYGSLFLYLMPFLKPAMVRPFYPDAAIETYEDAVRVVLEHSHIDPAARNVLMSHQFVTNNGAEPERCDSELLSIGGVDQVDARLFDSFDYVALGHIHGPQKVYRDTVRYCGSPLKYSFSEWRHKKSVTIVELKEKNQVELEMIPLIPLRDLRQIKGRLEDLLDPTVYTQGNPEDYLRVILTDEEQLYDPIGQLRHIYPNIMRLDLENRYTKKEDSSETAPDAVNLQSPLAMFAEFYEVANGVEMTAEEYSVMEKLMEEMAGESQ